jgi:hypothetical protein
MSARRGHPQRGYGTDTVEAPGAHFPSHILQKLALPAIGTRETGEFARFSPRIGEPPSVLSRSDPLMLSKSDPGSL